MSAESTSADTSADAAADTWDPNQYERFKAERRKPFDDLLALLRPVPGGRVVDLGCGTGELTAELHRASGAAETLGIDTSAAMLRDTAAITAATPGLRFAESDLTDFPARGNQPYDVVFTNAALQWVPDHPKLFAQITQGVAPGGQLAVQVPANFDHPSHTVADEVGRSFGLEPMHRYEGVLKPESYAALLDHLGYAEQHVRLQVYAHRMAATAEVIEWVKGTMLTHARRELGDRYPEFLAEYRTRLLVALGDPTGRRPHFYPFKRILLWARRGTPRPSSNRRSVF
jgi:trans-aconitate 2-methyltransferase